MSAARTARTELRVLILFIVLALAQAGVRPHSAPCRVCSFSCRFPGFGAVFVTVVFCITICISWFVTITATSFTQTLWPVCWLSPKAALAAMVSISDTKNSLS